MRYLPNQYINPALTIRDREMDTAMAEPYDPRPLTPKEVEEKQKKNPSGSPYLPGKSPIPSKNVMRNNDMTIAGAQDLDTKELILRNGMFVDENQIKYMWSPREQKFIDMGPYDPYYDGLPIVQGKRNTDMKIAKKNKRKSQKAYEDFVKDSGSQPLDEQIMDMDRGRMGGGLDILDDLFPRA